MKVIQDNSWQNQLGNVLGSFLGSRYQMREESKTIEQIKKDAIERFNDGRISKEGAQKFLKENPSLENTIKSRDVSDEALTNIGGLAGIDISKYKEIRDAAMRINQAGIDYNSAKDDAGRAAAHQLAQSNREILKKYGFSNGFDEQDNITTDTLNRLYSKMLNGLGTEAYKKNYYDSYRNKYGINISPEFTGFNL